VIFAASRLLSLADPSIAVTNLPLTKLLMPCF
jgi:hypothetical protein